MGWDLHFTNTKKIGDILADDEFNIEYYSDDDYVGAYIYTHDKEGERSGVWVPNVTEDNYKEEYLTYGRLSYGGRLGYFLWRLYEKFGIMFADTCLDDYFYLQDYCENEEEDETLYMQCFAKEMVHFFGLDESHELYQMVESAKPLMEELDRRYQSDNHREVKAMEIKVVDNNMVDDLPF